VIKEIEKKKRQNIGIYLNYQKRTHVLKKTNNPELGTGWHRKKESKNYYYIQPKYKQIPSIKRPTPNPKTNKQTNKLF